MPIRRPIETFRNFHHHLPYRGRNDYFGSINSSPGMGDAFSIRQLQLKDAAPAPVMLIDDFDLLVYNIRTNLIPGERIKAVSVKDRDGDAINGRVVKILIDYKKKTIRVIMRDDNMKLIEVFPETIFRIDRDVFESNKYVPTISDLKNFIKYLKS
jgi:hypothetical protein